ncbi:signal peptidase I [Phytohabitans sp. ZYX-F-186]|uniref:Signal peptidase I n=1 Tax=Phytohabitans maris TaxID=3071409 RepID=A0ABU0ZMC6_9ACTN|nr:signal peptidase I [Phytohabitans sp. ZYX-F-186]MDQ7908188.1 signal peptidase I [Phytohabitans sp. ZYX-F-186]
MTGLVRRLAYRMLVLAVRGRRDRGGDWGEAVLAEFPGTSGGWQALRWSVGGVRTALRERRAARSRAATLRRRIAVAAAVAVLAPFGVQHWLLTPVYVPSAAMAPTLAPGDRWLMDRVSFRLTGLRHADVVAFARVEQGRRFTAVRRVIGLAGDEIGCRDGAVLRNGAVLDEPYLAGPAAPAGCAPMTVPAGTVYVLGDARGVAREWSPVPLDRIEGRLLTRL